MSNRPKDREDIISHLVKDNVNRVKNLSPLERVNDMDLWDELSVEERVDAVNRFRELIRPSPNTSHSPTNQ